jgi:hypothetical protein
MGDERPASEVLGLLADDTRLGILRTLAEAQAERRRPGTAALSFSAIYDGVDVDNTSKLAYHLGELEGVFLRKTGDGYAFTHAGDRLVRFVLAGNYRTPEPLGPVSVDGVCLECGATALEARLREQYFTVACAECDRPAFAYRVSPAQVRRRDAAVVDAVAAEQTGDFLTLRRGVCPDCAGRIETTVLGPAADSLPDGAPVSYATASDCRDCLRFVSAPLTHAVAYHPDAVAFHREHGLDVLETPFWRFHRHLRDGSWTADTADDAAYLVAMQAGGDELRLFLDEAATVARTVRVRVRE